MDEETPPDKKDFRDEAIKKEARKLKARRNREVSAWWGFSLFGLVGWSVVVPALIGVFVGGLLEHHYTGSHSWTVALLLTGICVGSVLALFLLAKELFKKEDE
ncbi:MAG: AtpZ/AtpI family protein [Bacteriovoracaceae bacterium]|nr:AtpZ/AtpI family protein [Bacteriovoracaceae bacterium]